MKDPVAAVKKDAEQNGDVSVVTLASVYSAAPKDSVSTELDVCCHFILV